jgi:hypothetical protein
MNFTLAPSPKRPMTPQGGEVTEFNPTFSRFYGYLGCSQTSEFTDFAAGLDFVAVYAVYRQIVRAVTKSNRSSCLDALTWLKLHLNPDGSRNMALCAILDSNDVPDPDNSVIPYTLDAVWTKYHRVSGAADKMLGCLLYIADEIFQRGAWKHNTDSNEPLQAASSARVYDNLQSDHIAFAWVIPTEQQTSDTWRKDRGLPHGLRPECVQDYGEHICERWNRIWHCLKMVDYYISTSKGEKGDVMWIADPLKTLDEPSWWRTQAISDPIASASEERDTVDTVKAVFRSGKKRNHVRQVDCIWRLASDQDEPYDYLRSSPHQSYAQRLYREIKVLSPCEFRVSCQWNSYVSVLLKFEELELDVMEVKMLLFDDNGLNSVEECIIYDEDQMWNCYEVDEALHEAYAQKAIFTVKLEPGQFPAPIPFTMPKGLNHLLQFGEDMGTTVDKDTQTSASVNAQSDVSSSNASAVLDPPVLESTLAQETADSDKSPSETQSILIR